MLAFDPLSGSKTHNAQRSALALLVGLIALLAIPAIAAADCVDADRLPAEIGVKRTSEITLCLINEQRTSRNLPPLTLNAKLARASRNYALLMVRERFFDHTAPSGTTTLQRIRKTGYLKNRGPNWTIGENLAWGSGDYATPQQIVDGWMKSPGHRSNILKRAYREVGFGIILDAPVADYSGPASTYVSAFGNRGR